MTCTDTGKQLPRFGHNIYSGWLSVMAFLGQQVGLPLETVILHQFTMNLVLNKFPVMKYSHTLQQT